MLLTCGKSKGSHPGAPPAASGGSAGEPPDERCVVALTLDAPCCFAGWPCSCAPSAVQRSELAQDPCKVEYPVEIADVPSSMRTACNSTPDAGCDPVTCIPAAYFAFEDDSVCQWCRHEGPVPPGEVAGRAPDGSCVWP